MCGKYQGFTNTDFYWSFEHFLNDISQVCNGPCDTKKDSANREEMNVYMIKVKRQQNRYRCLIDETRRKLSVSFTTFCITKKKKNN